MAKSTDYFALLGAQVSHCVRAAELLNDFFRDYRAGALAERRAAMHAIEHEADEVQHDILRRLASEFITPIEQEDITHLVQIIDDVTDALDNVLLECYMYHVDALPAGAAEFAARPLACVRTLQTAVGELRGFKKPARLRALLVEVNDMETEADAAYIEAVHGLFGAEHDVRRLLGGKAIFDSMESCCDLCEHAADVIDRIIMKNA